MEFAAAALVAAAALPKPEIGDLDHAFNGKAVAQRTLVNEDVFRLEIAMYQAALVRVFQAGQNLAQDGDRVGEGVSFLSLMSGRRLVPGTYSIDEIWRIAVGIKADGPDDIGMQQAVDGGALLLQMADVSRDRSGSSQRQTDPPRRGGGPRQTSPNAPPPIFSSRMYSLMRWLGVAMIHRLQTHGSRHSKPGTHMRGYFGIQSTTFSAIQSQAKRL